MRHKQERPQELVVCKKVFFHNTMHRFSMLNHFLVGQTCSALGSSGSQNLSPVSCCHSLAETMLFFSLKFFRLISSFHVTPSFRGNPLSINISGVFRCLRRVPVAPGGFALLSSPGVSYRAKTHNEDIIDYCPAFCQQFMRFSFVFFCGISRLPSLFSAKTLPENHSEKRDSSCHLLLFVVLCIISRAAPFLTVRGPE